MTIAVVIVAIVTLLGVGVRTPGPCHGNEQAPPGSDLP